ncbi:hypothetical protein C4D60_Mb03t03950 [Musa balbisiana]|uniref:DYW domain-containing protein n=1 Tax=Musa balbisiana TaxID=52838 RepID=A0A4S8J7D2_MUSBA|nr:hypothetical protein C4D60_Mb03t03950 [Musa balbisiana]
MKHGVLPLPLSKHKTDDYSKAFRSLANSPRCPPQDAYSSILELCASRKAPLQGQQVHSHIVKSNSLSDDGFLSTKLLFMYGKCGQLRDAEKLFDEMPSRSIFAWNALVGAYASNDRPSLAIATFQEMRVSGILPDACTLASVLKACGALEDVDTGTATHGLAVKCGLDSTGFVSNALVSMYAKCGRFGSARQLFERMDEERDVVSWNSIISACLQDGQFFEVLTLFREMQRASIPMNSYTTVGVLQACAELSLPRLGMEIHASLLKNDAKLEIYECNALVVLYARCGRIGNAMQVFCEMEEKDTVSWNSMLSGYVQNGLYQEAIDFFCEIVGLGFEADQVSLISVASASGRSGNRLHGKEVHAYAMKHGLDSDLQVGNTLIDMYTKCRFIDYAERVFYKLHSKDCISWTTMIAGYAQNSRYSKALELFRQVQADGMKADSMMLGSILQACSGMVCLSLLKQVHGYAIRHGLLDLVLNNTIIDVYGECGKVSRACHVFGTIRDKDVVSWTSMITCYVSNGLLNEALCLFRDMVAADVDPDAVSLITVLAAAAGLSSSMKGKEIHGFMYRRRYLTEGTVSSSLVDMYARCGDIENSFKLAEIIESLKKEGGYTENTKFVLQDVPEEEKIKLLHGHSERLAMAFGMLCARKGTPIRITKNLRVCGDCHEFTKLVSKLYEQEIIVRDANRFHHFRGGSCSCRDFCAVDQNKRPLGSKFLKVPLRVRAPHLVAHVYLSVRSEHAACVSEESHHQPSVQTVP